VDEEDGLVQKAFAVFVLLGLSVTSQAPPVPRPAAEFSIQLPSGNSVHLSSYLG
jgi:hypothetical protein